MRILPSWEPEISMEKIDIVYFEVHSLKHSYVPVNSKSAHPHWAYTRNLTGVLLRTVGNLIQNEALLVGHLTFVSKRWSALQAKGFRNFSAFSMCIVSMGHCSYIHCFVGAFEIL